MLAGLVLVAASVDLVRSDCKRHFEQSVLPLLLRQLPRVRPGLKITKWRGIEREDRTEWQPNGEPTRRLGFTFERMAKVRDLEVTLSGKYMAGRPTEVHGTINLTLSGKWSGDNWHVPFLKSIKVAPECVKPFQTEKRSAFPKVKLGNLDWELWAGPLASSSIGGKHSVVSAEFRALTVLKR